MAPSMSYPRRSYKTSSAESDAQSRDQRRDAQSRSTGSSTMAAGHPRRGVVQPDGSSSLAMFQSIIKKQNGQSSPGSTPNSASNISLLNGVAKIQRMLEREGATAAEAFAYFMKTLYPQLVSPEGSALQVVKDQLANLLFPKLAAEILAKGFTSTDLPTLSHFTELMLELDVFKPALWGTLAIRLVDLIRKLNTEPTGYPSIESYETAMAQREALIRDLVRAWITVIPQKSETEESASIDAPDSKATEDTLSTYTSVVQEPALDDIPDEKHGQHGQQQGGAQEDRKPSFRSAFARLLPDYPARSLVAPSWAALATYALLADIKSNSSLRQEAAPFLELMRQLLAGTRAPSPILGKLPFDGCPEGLAPFLNQFLARSRAGVDAGWQAPSTTPDSVSFSIHKKASRAVRSRNPQGLDEAWRTMWGENTTPDAERVQQLQGMATNFDYFIFAYMAMHKSQRALDVWNAMTGIGIHPTIKTWTSMMHGCSQAKNANGIKTVWKRLVASGTQLDTPVWTARISGLIMSGDIDGGLAALNEMAQVWRERDRPENATIAVEPSVAPVNGAIAWLVRLNRFHLVTKVLVWAGKQGIDPDIYTFNTMLRPLVRQGDKARLNQILDMMKSFNVHPDGATFTILLDGVLADISTKTSEQQVEIVTRFMREVETASVNTKMLTYGKIIYLLLREEGADSDGAAVKAVLAHIWASGLELSSHIYTMLAEHYFSSSPPAASAVTALIRNRGLLTNPNIDRVFWERVIKGYCQIGDTQSALDIFAKVFDSGSTITFSTLYEFLIALLETRRIDDAKNLVRAAKEFRDAEDEELTVGDKKRRYWRHRFWHLAEQRGLMEKDIRETFQAAQVHETR